MNTKKIAFLALVCIFMTTFISVSSYSGFGYSQKNLISQYYLRNSLEQTGSANVVSAVVWDYRGFDTLGEETVLFTVLVGVLTVLTLNPNTERLMHQ